jgi:hypothetical protein
MKLIPLTQGKFAQVDDGDFEWLMRYKWHVHLGYSGILYAERGKWINGKLYTMIMHREIFLVNSIKALFHIDHTDGNELNNQKFNLRAATNSQNQANSKLRIDNTSGYKGVTFHKVSMKFRAQIQYQKERIHIGLFTDPIDAAVKYDRYARRLFKNYARLNFPE